MSEEKCFHECGLDVIPIIYNIIENQRRLAHTRVILRVDTPDVSLCLTWTMILQRAA